MKTTIIAITGYVAPNQRVMPLVFVDPVRVNGQLVSKIPVTPAQVDNLTEGMAIEISLEGKTPTLEIPSPIPGQLKTYSCPQCGSPLQRHKSQLFCPDGCAQSGKPALNDLLFYPTQPKSYSTDPLMFQALCRKLGCFLFPDKEKKNTWNLYYHDRLELMRLGYGVGQWARKLDGPKPHKQKPGPFRNPFLD
jgi:hypothetical protein